MRRAAGLALGFAADAVLGDPARWHPVAGFGRVAAGLERGLHGDSRARGVVFTSVLVGSTSLLGVLAERRWPLLSTAVATWAVLGGRSLDREGGAVARLLAADDLPAARRRLTHLVGRDTSRLDASEVARATVESLAENTSDAVVSPLVLGAAFGVPGLVGYRAANTLDAMVGHRSPRYRRFGWASARLDDLLNLPGARLTALLGALLAPTVGGSTGEALSTWRRDAAGHPSPNAGPVEASFAGALGVRLGGVNLYDGVAEDRHVLGRGRAVAPSDVARARRLAGRVSAAALLVCATVAAGVGRPRFNRAAGGPRPRPRPAA